MKSSRVDNDHFLAFAEDIDWLSSLLKCKIDNENCIAAIVLLFGMEMECFLMEKVKLQAKTLCNICRPVITLKSIYVERNTLLFQFSAFNDGHTYASRSLWDSILSNECAL